MARPSLPPKILARPRRRPLTPATLLDIRLDQLACLFEQYVESSERARHEGMLCVAQANEAQRALRAAVEQSPALTANVVALAVGERFGDALIAAGLHRPRRPRLRAVPSDRADELAA